MLLVVAIHLLQLSQTSMAVNKNNYHITLKNLRTGVLHGFMLAGGDTPYMVQGVDNIAQRIQDGEILYSDFSNSRVFAQENWSEGISKYWEPEKNWYYIFPSKKYKDKKNIRINNGEFTLGSSVTPVFTYTKWDWPICRWESAWVVYTADWLKLYRSEDYWNTWTIFKDFSSEATIASVVDEITDIKYIYSNPFTMSHTWEMETMSLAAMKQLWVCFYNRSTNHTEVARYDIDFWIKSYSWSTFKKSYSWTISAAYWSKRDFLDVNTNAIPSWEVQWYLHQYTYSSSTKTFFFLSSWTCASNGFFPWQKFKARRNSTGVVYDCTVRSLWWWFSSWSSSPNECNISGIPWYSVTSADNQYTIYDIGKTWSLCLPITVWWIENIVACWFGLGQTFDYEWNRFYINGISNGISNFWNEMWNFDDSHQPASSITAVDYVIISKVWWWDVWPYLNGRWNLTFTMNKWIFSNGNYLNNITKFINVSHAREHLWWINHINPHAKLYDIAYWEIATRCDNSMIYNMSYIWGIASPQNHTYEFSDGLCPISGLSYPQWNYQSTLWIWNQNWISWGTEAKLVSLPLNNNMTKPLYNVIATLWEEWITDITYFQDIIYIWTKWKWFFYEYTVNASTPVMTRLAQLPLNNEYKSTIDAVTNFAGNIVCSNQAWSWIYIFDLVTRQNAAPLIEVDSYCWVNDLNNTRVYSICNTGWPLLFSTEWKIYLYYEYENAVEWYLESSIYWGYISNVDKLWVYGYVRLSNPIDTTEKIAMQFSFDDGKTWKFCPTKKWNPFIDTIDWNDPTYAAWWEQWSMQLTFIFPYNTKSGTIIYRCWLKKWSTVVPVVNHIGIHFNLNYKQELLFNYQIDLNKSYELLNGREVEKDRQNDKLLFLKDIWQNQDMVELIDVTGGKYTCIPFSDDRTPWQGLVISTANANGSIKDLDNLVYKVAFWLKTIANYEKIL